MLRMRRGVLFPAMAAAGLGGLSLRRFGFFPPFAANTRRGRRAEAVLERVRPLAPVLPFQLFGGTLTPQEASPAGP